MKLSIKNKLERATYEILNSDSLTYLLDISLDWDSFACPVYHFSIVAKGHREKNRDNSLAETIQAVFGSFVNISPYPIVIIYSDEGNRQLIRQRLFDRWFNATAVSGFRKYDLFGRALEGQDCFSVICREGDARLQLLLDPIQELLS